MLLGSHEVQSQVVTRLRGSLLECEGKVGKGLQGKETLATGDEEHPALLPLPFLYLYSFLIQWPCQPLKCLITKSQAHLSFVSLVLVTPILSAVTF